MKVWQTIKYNLNTMLKEFSVDYRYCSIAINITEIRKSFSFFFFSFFFFLGGGGPMVLSRNRGGISRPQQSIKANYMMAANEGGEGVITEVIKGP